LFSKPLKALNSFQPLEQFYRVLNSLQLLWKALQGSEYMHKDRNGLQSFE